MIDFTVAVMAMDPKAWLNLERVAVLALEQSVFGQKILCQILRGFGTRDIHSAKDLGNAIGTTNKLQFHLVIVDAGFDGGKGLEFVRTLRHASTNANRFVPVIMLVGHSTLSSVHLSRNSGANFVVAKPCAPGVLLERILWVARDKRPYVEVGDYAGPDRRFHEEEFAEGIGRRTGDRSTEDNKTAPDLIVASANAH